MKYTQYYCEENIWHLCQHPSLEGSECSVMFIGSTADYFPMWCQQAGDPVCWDYHVVLLERRDAGWQVWDLDTALGFPIPLEDYLTASFPLGPTLEEELQPRFRLIPATEYVETFSSDRRHMRGDDGSWLAPPPDWPAICRDGVHNLDEFIDMTVEGTMSLADLVDTARRSMKDET